MESKRKIPYGVINWAKLVLADGTVGRTYFTGFLPITLDDLSSCGARSSTPRRFRSTGSRLSQRRALVPTYFKNLEKHYESHVRDIAPLPSHVEGRGRQGTDQDDRREMSG